MNSTLSPSAYCWIAPSLCLSTSRLHLWSSGQEPLSRLSQIRFTSLRRICNLPPSLRATSPLNEGTIPMINFEDFLEKDWSFLETDPANSDEEHRQKTARIISAAEIDEASRILISTGSEEFVDRVVESSPYEQLLVVHDSLLTLACIKEKHDKVKCWQGELIFLPEKWSPFDVVFLYFLPALPFELRQIFSVFSKHCLPGTRVVISHLYGRQALEDQQRQHPDIVVSGLPSKSNLLDVAADCLFDLAEFLDEPDFYLAVLKFKAKTAE